MDFAKKLKNFLRFIFFALAHAAGAVYNKKKSSIKER